MTPPGRPAPTLRTNPGATRPARRAPRDAAACVALVEIAWPVTRLGLGAAAPPGAARMVELVVREDGLNGPGAPGPAARSWLRDGGACVELALPGEAAPTLIRDGAQFHLECPGVVHATVVLAGSKRLLAYARTPLMERLGVPGGRLEPGRLRIEPGR